MDTARLVSTGGSFGRTFHVFLYCGLVRSSLAEKALGALVDTRLDTSQQCALVARAANGVLGCISSVASSSGVTLPLCSALLKSCLEFYAVLALYNSGLPSTRETWTYWREPSEGSWRWWSGGSLLWEKSARAGTVQPGEKKAWGGSLYYR